MTIPAVSQMQLSVEEIERRKQRIRDLWADEMHKIAREYAARMDFGWDDPAEETEPRHPKGVRSCWTWDSASKWP
jgi:hypothetical protein